MEAANAWLAARVASTRVLMEKRMLACVCQRLALSKVRTDGDGVFFPRNRRRGCKGVMLMLMLMMMLLLFVAVSE